MSSTPSGSVRGPRLLPAAVSPLTADLLSGPVVPAVVLGAHAAGVYLDVAGRVLPVLARDAVDLPPALRTADSMHRAARWPVRAGEVVDVGGGSVRLPGLEVRAVRTWRPARVRVVPGAGTAPPAAARPREAAAVASMLRDVVDATDSSWLLEPVRAALVGDPGPAVAALVGLGPGLTPSGDDALAGALLVARALGHGNAPILAAAVRTHLATGRRTGRQVTTATSAALLGAAADGYAAGAVVGLVDAVTGGGPDAVAAALPAVLAIGHTSGRDTVAGVAAALDTLVVSGRIAA